MKIHILIDIIIQKKGQRSIQLTYQMSKTLTETHTSVVLFKIRENSVKMFKIVLFSFKSKKFISSHFKNVV